MTEAILFARHEPCAGSVDFEERSEAIVLKLEEPVGMIEGGGAALQCERHHIRKC